MRAWFVAALALLGGAAAAPAQSPATFWIDPAWSDSTPAGTVARVTLWFDRQLLEGGDAYARRTTRLRDAARHALRTAIVDSLKSLSRASWERARPAIEQLTRAGVLERCRPHWIVNSVTCDLPGGDPARLSEVPGAFRAYRAFARPAQAPPAGVAVHVRECSVSDTFVPPPERASWNARHLGIDRAWRELRVSGRGVKHVVHDFGWSFAPAAIRGTVWCNPGEVPGNGRDDDGNGLVDDVHGFNFDRGDNVLGPGNPLPPANLTHGDLTAAVLAGRMLADTALIVGMAPNSRWAAVQSSLSIEPGVEWAIENGFDVYSMSFSLANLRELRGHWRRVMEHGALAGLFFVSGAGNFANPQSPNYAPVPAQMRIPEDVPLAVLGVSGVGRDGRRPGFASQGPVEWRTVDYQDGTVSKPDLATINTNLGVVDSAGRYSYRAPDGWQGNSFAGPHLAGVLALMLEVDPELTPWRAREILLATARDIDPPGVDTQTGAGVVDAYRAVLAVRQARPGH